MPSPPGKVLSAAKRKRSVPFHLTYMQFGKLFRTSSVSPSGCHLPQRGRLFYAKYSETSTVPAFSHSASSFSGLFSSSLVRLFHK